MLLLVLLIFLLFPKEWLVLFAVAAITGTADSKPILVLTMFLFLWLIYVFLFMSRMHI